MLQVCAFKQTCQRSPGTDLTRPNQGSCQVHVSVMAPNNVPKEISVHLCQMSKVKFPWQFSEDCAHHTKL